MEKIQLLFTSAGRRSYLINYFKEAIQAEGLVGLVHAANSSPIAPAFLTADKTVVTPMIYSADYIPFLIHYCKENEITAVMSLLDADLPVLAANKKRFDEIGTRLIVSDSETISICNDKYKTYTFLTNNGVLVPKTYISLESVLSDLKNGKIQYPLIVKPRWGAGSISIMEANDEEDLRVLYKIAKGKVLNSYLRFESAQNEDECVVIQEMLFGEEHGLDVINDLNGNYINTIVKKKIAMRSGETDCGVTVENEILRELGEKISGLLHHVALLDVDAFMVNGQPYILEMNPRFGGGYPFSHVAGANVPRAVIRWLSDHKVENIEVDYGVTAQKDIHMIRY